MSEPDYVAVLAAEYRRELQPRRFIPYVKSKMRLEYEQNLTDKHYIMGCLYDIARVNFKKYTSYPDYCAAIKNRMSRDDGIDHNDLFDREMQKLVEEERVGFENEE